MHRQPDFGPNRLRKNVLFFIIHVFLALSSFFAYLCIKWRIFFARSYFMRIFLYICIFIPLPGMKKTSASTMRRLFHYLMSVQSFIISQDPTDDLAMHRLIGIPFVICFCLYKALRLEITDIHLVADNDAACLAEGDAALQFDWI